MTVAAPRPSRCPVAGQPGEATFGLCGRTLPFARIYFDLDGSSSFLMMLGLALFVSLYENVVRDDVPGIVNANEEQEQHRRADEEQGWARMRVRCARRYDKHCV